MEFSFKLDEVSPFEITENPSSPLLNHEPVLNFELLIIL